MEKMIKEELTLQRRCQTINKSDIWLLQVKGNVIMVRILFSRFKKNGTDENWNPLYIQSIKGRMDYYKKTTILQVTFMNDLHKVHILLLISLSSMLNTLASSFSNLREQRVTLEYKSILVITKHLAKLWPIIEKSMGLYWGSMDHLPIMSPHL